MATELHLDWFRRKTDMSTRLDKSTPIKNFHQVNDWLYRGGQPRQNEFVHLKELQVKTVVNLRWRSGPLRRERIWVENLDMDFVHIPLNYWTMPSRSQVDQFLSVLDDRQRHPIFVHCFHGADRTGVLIAMFRILRCGWSLEAAYSEMVSCGFHRYSTRHFKWALWQMAKNAEGNRLG